MDVKRIDDLKLIPKSLMQSQDFLAKALWTLVKHCGSLHYKVVTKEFTKFSGYRIEDFFEFDEKDMAKYFEMKKHMFGIDRNGYVTSKNYDENNDAGPLSDANKKRLGKNQSSTAKGKNSLQIIEID